ncbi:TetR/AcrR family transcriptional regulator [Compostimonas suwonensis]|uniref:AcrR family transcriptional regulator n=1 Tax=Compostimonas suwonensis TaxID=1048394 RepID=A0A2M9BUE5_9MICO|nr:TetR/AcrR family transcriptional regulator [Compostimonas suwonensis]PJJ61575.1 AcrR family transcriptional regulator [Compostimonas suwonensis]
MTPETHNRARPLSVEDRQAMIIDAATPLVIAHGRAVTSKQIAEAAGIAEGTIFRAFGDKDTLIRRVVENYFDPQPFRDGLRAIDLALPLEQKIAAIVVLMRGRLEHVFRMVAALGADERPTDGQRHEYAHIIAELLVPDRDRLRCPPYRVAQIIRMVALASVLPGIGETIPFDVDDITQIILYGVSGEPDADHAGHATAGHAHGADAILHSALDSALDSAFRSEWEPTGPTTLPATDPAQTSQR